GFSPAIRETDIPISLVDVLPTLTEYVGTKLPAPVDGRSLLPLLKGEEVQRPPVFIQYDGNGSLGNFQRSLVDGRYKIIVDFFKDEVFVERYDVVSDPLETRNLAFSKADRVGEMLQQLKRTMEETGDRMELPPNAYAHFIENYPNP